MKEDVLAALEGAEEMVTLGTYRIMLSKSELKWLTDLVEEADGNGNDNESNSND